MSENIATDARKITTETDFSFFSGVRKRVFFCCVLSCETESRARCACLLIPQWEFPSLVAQTKSAVNGARGTRRSDRAS